MSELEIERRRREQGVSIAELCVQAQIAYSRAWHGLRGTRLSAEELRRLDRAMTAIEQHNRLSPVA
jgi:hypothetical protein